jgi:YegS/Rv2252/BmrU family lipid kinase
MVDRSNAQVGVIVNPVAGRFKDPGHWTPVVEEIRRRFPRAQLRTTQGPGDERRMASELFGLSINRLIVAGGDGSVHQVIDALLASPLAAAARPSLGFVPLGSGNDFARGLGIPLTPLDAIRALESARERSVDIGRLTFLGETPVRSAFWMNQSYLGFGARVVDRVARGSRPADQRAYVRSALRELLHAHAHRYSLRSDEGLVESAEAVNLLVTNGRYSGSGMLTSPRADPSDGAFDVVFVGPMGRIRLLRGLSRFRAGTHLSMPEVRTWRVKSLEVRGERSDEIVEADGDIVGKLPARYEVVPDAIRVLVPSTPNA